MHWTNFCMYFATTPSKNYYIITQEVLREKCPYSKLFWSVFSGIRTEYGDDDEFHREFKSIFIEI